MKKTNSKYISISEEVIKSIEAGDLLPGDKTPSENELISKYKISNTTARKSLSYLEQKGWAKKIKGKGTFVLNRTQDKQLTRTLGSLYDSRIGFDENLVKEGLTPKNIILEKTILNTGVSTNVSGHHYIIDGPVLKIHRLRYADEILLKDETRYISLSLCPKINMLESSKPFFKIYEDIYKLKISDVKQSLSVTIFSPKDQNNYFETPTPLPVFILDGAIFNTDNKVIEVEKSFYRGDKYKFSILVHPEYNR